MTMQAIPEIVAKRVQYAMAELQWCTEELERLFALDSRFGGDGRYESEGWRALQGRIETAKNLLDQFQSIAVGLRPYSPTRRGLQYRLGPWLEPWPKANQCER